MNGNHGRWRECAITLTWDPERQHTIVEASFAVWHRGEPFVSEVDAVAVGGLLGSDLLEAEVRDIVRKYWRRVTG